MRPSGDSLLSSTIEPGGPGGEAPHSNVGGRGPHGMLGAGPLTAGFVITMTSLQRAAGQGGSPIDSTTAWLRLAVAVLLSTVGGVGMWSFMVALPAIQTDFGVSRADASLPFTLVMIGFAGGGVLMGRLADRFGIARAAGHRDAGD